MKQIKKIDVVNGIQYSYSSEWIKELESELHWRLYWRQQKLIQKYLKRGDSILEIGIGTGFTANYLKSKGFDVITFDIDKEKNPDIVGNIVEYNWSNHSFDKILAFEVFEHIPFKEFKRVLKNLKIICNDYLFISLPLNEKTLFEVEYKIPKFEKKFIYFSVKKNKITTENHFWEVNYKQYSEDYIENVFIERGYLVVEKIKYNNFIYYVLKIKND